eukprot:13410683-Ditylum_brightwellii.AAC.1
MAEIKQTPRTGVYERLDVAPKDNDTEEDDNALKGSVFDGVRHSLRIKKKNLSEDVKETNKLGKKTNIKYKLDDKIDGGDNSNESNVEGGEGSRKSSVEGNTEEEDMASSSRNSKVDHQGEEYMSRTAGSLVLCTSESDNNNKTKQDREGHDAKVLFNLGGDPERPVCNVVFVTPLMMGPEETP